MTSRQPASANHRATIISMAVIAIAFSSLLHEGLGHALTSYLRGDIPTQLTSNHLSDIRPDRLVDAAGTLAMIAAYASTRRANLRYFLWLFGSINLLDATGYFLFSGILGFGDWQAAIAGLPHYLALRIAMTIFGAITYYLVVALMARLIHPYVPTRNTYNTVARLPYYAACLFYCIAGAFDPLGIKLLFISTIPAAFGGLSGFMWGDALLPRTPPAQTLTVVRQPLWIIAAAIIGIAYILILGRGINFTH